MTLAQGLLPVIIFWAIIGGLGARLRYRVPEEPTESHDLVPSASGTGESI